FIGPITKSCALALLIGAACSCGEKGSVGAARGKFEYVGLTHDGRESPVFNTPQEAEEWVTRNGGKSGSQVFQRPRK
ncbi:MAG: hypothetical protein P8M65_09545, partial [Roseibacillus sp.]|nr:hypothetical protein [Roseibacillus sp.]